jgi:hypothetical protein
MGDRNHQTSPLLKPEDYRKRIPLQQDPMRVMHAPQKSVRSTLDLANCCVEFDDEGRGSSLISLRVVARCLLGLRLSGGVNLKDAFHDRRRQGYVVGLRTKEKSSQRSSASTAC